MRIVLVYPPVLPTNSAEELLAVDDGDKCQMPIGMYILGAMLRESGHTVELHNFARTPWDEALAKIEACRPELFAITCYSFHRHYVAKMTRQIRERCPAAKIVVGGVHVSPMPLTVLERWPWIDYVAVSEAELSFPALVERLEAGESTEGLLGIASRDSDGVPVFPGRQPVVPDLDVLPQPARYWPHHIISASRGCPFNCNFCSSPSIWGRSVRERSPAHVVEELQLLRSHGIRQVHFKDETFTFKRSRVAELCQAIIDADLQMWWTCDTRADCLDEERIQWLRRAGCFLVSLGVETGSPDLIHYYQKREKAEKVVAAGELARKYGLFVRHYYITGAPTETNETLGHTLDLIERSKPQRVFMSQLAVLPGTALEHEMRQKKGWDESIWFDREEEWINADDDNRFLEFDNWPRLVEYTQNKGLRNTPSSLLFPLSIDDLTSAAQLLPDTFAAHYDLGQALLEAERYEEAAQALRQAGALRPSLGKTWIDLATCLTKLGREQEALEALVAVEPIEGLDTPQDKANHLIALLRRAEILGDLGQAGEALALCRRVLDEAPGTAEAFALACRLLVRTGQLQGAEALARSWASEDPDSAGPYLVLALCKGSLGDVEGATAFFKEAHRRSPDDATILHEGAVTLAQLGALDDARLFLDVCLHKHPNDPQTLDLLAQLPVAERTIESPTPTVGSVAALAGG